MFDSGENLLCVGDVIMSEVFRYGQRQHDGTICIMRATEDQTAIDDESRAQAKFVIESVEMEGKLQFGGIDNFDSLHVSARRLGEDWFYNHKGEVIDFYVIGCSEDQVDPSSVKIIGKAIKSFEIYSLTR